MDEFYKSLTSVVLLLLSVFVLRFRLTGFLLRIFSRTDWLVHSRTFGNNWSTCLIGWMSPCHWINSKQSTEGHLKQWCQLGKINNHPHRSLTHQLPVPVHIYMSLTEIVFMWKFWPEKCYCPSASQNVTNKR